jgi:SAM-dependent methyltransferase
VSDPNRFQDAYAGGARPPWDIGGPQPAMEDALRRGWVHGRVLDAGCGTGEHALLFAAAGHEVVGADVAPAAIERAAAKARARRLPDPPRFVVGDLLHEPVALAGTSFGTVIDMGFFHTLSDDERLVWRSSLVRLLEPGGSYVMVCFSELVPGTTGPRRVSGAEIRLTFSATAGFVVRDLERSSLRTLREGVTDIPAWLARIERV